MLKIRKLFDRFIEEKFNGKLKCKRCIAISIVRAPVRTVLSPFTTFMSPTEERKKHFLLKTKEIFCVFYF